MARVAGLLILVTICGCVSASPPPIDVVFDPAAHEYASRPGKAEVSGQAFLRRRDGVVVYGAGGVVLLIPSTQYTQTIASQGGASNIDPRLTELVRRTQADGEGRFMFKDIPDGDYIVSAVIEWMAGDSPQGGEVSANVTVKDGQNQQVIVTR